MKSRILVCIVLLATFACAGEDTIRFARSFKEGELDRYKAKMTLIINGAHAETEMAYKQIVTKIYPNAEADVETTITALKIKVDGKLMDTTIPAAMVQRFTSSGIPIGNPTGGQGQMRTLDYAKLIGAIMDKSFSIRKEVPIDWTDSQEPKNKLKGVIKVESVAKGVAKIQGRYDVWNEKTTDKPINVKLSILMDVASSKPNKLEGTMINIPLSTEGMSVDEVRFVVERILK